MAACLGLLDFLFLCFGFFIYQPNDEQIVNEFIYLSKIGVRFKLLYIIGEMSTGTIFLVFFKAALYTPRNRIFERTIL